MSTQRWVLLTAVPLLFAGTAEVAWRSKAISQWSQEDARQILTDSPWAKSTVAMVSGLQTEDERREGGNMGQDHGVGYDGIDPKGSKPSIVDVIKGPSGGVDTRRASRAIRLRVLWESALPIRAAEIKASVVEPPTLEGDGYRIAVYGVPGTYFKKDPKSLGEPLRKLALLRRDGKKDVKPSSAEVFQRENDLVVVYLFPLSAELSRRDGIVELVAQIGRMSLVQPFNLTEMEFRGTLEL